MQLLVFALVLTGYLGNCEDARGLNVTLAVFSGVPDPKWLVTPSSPDYETIMLLFKNAKKANAVHPPEQMPGQLGYKGFLVQEIDQEDPVLILGSETNDLQQALLQSIPKDAIPKSLKDQICVVIRGGKVVPDLRDLKEDRTKRAAPNYEGATFTWNHNYARPRNNCYNYANDRVTNTFAQPGRGSGQRFAAITNDQVREASRRDGLIRVDAGPVGAIPTVPPNGPRHLVALVVDPGVDYHWYRLDSNGRWSHKPGQTRITDRDGAANLIYDPRLAANALGGPNYAFVCFMTTDKNTVNIN